MNYYKDMDDYIYEHYERNKKYKEFLEDEFESCCRVSFILGEPIKYWTLFGYRLSKHEF